MKSQFLDELVTKNPGVDAAGILALCTLDKRTVNPVDGAMFRVWLSVDGKAERLERTGRMLVQQYPGNTVVQKSVDRLMVIVRYGFTGAPFDTTDSAFAEQAQELSNTMVTFNSQDETLGLTPTEVAELVALGGGYQVFDATLEECEASITRVTRKQALDVLRDLRFAADGERAGKWNWLKDHPDAAVPADLAALDAMVIPDGGG